MMKVVVIGAGPAGSIAAIALRRRGDEVTLIEQHRFPRDKVCGECLSALGIDVLHRLGMGNRFGKTPRTLRRSVLYGRDGERVEVALPRPMWGISRKRLDSELLNAAREAGAKILQPARCESLLPVRVRDLISNAVRTIECDHVFLADGKAPDGEAIEDFGVKAHFVDVNAPDDAIGLYGLDGHYVGLAPVEGGVWNLAFSVPKRKVREDYDEMIFGNTALARQMRNGRRMSEWLIAPLPRFQGRDDLPGNVTALGNAYSAIEPIGGEGMGLAMASGYALGGDGLWQNRPAACRAVARVMSSRCGGLAVEVAGINEQVARVMMGFMGK